MASGESTVTGRRPARNLGLSVFNPDNSSDDEIPSQRIPQQQPVHPGPKPLPQQPSYFPQQLQQQPRQPQQQQQQTPQQQFARPTFRQSTHPIHSASSSTSSISISTSSPQTGFQFPSGARHGQAQSSPINRYATGSPHTYVGSSSSSRSSPAMDTTPPPSTPGNNLPPVSFAGGVTDDRNLDGLGLSVVDESDYTPQSYNHARPDPRSGVFPYVDPVMNTSQAQLAVKQTPAPAQPALERRESVDRLIITATADAENHVIVDITGAKDAAFIRERIFSKLRIPEEEHAQFSIYRTELGEAALGDPVSDDQLMIYCGAWADGKGTLKFLVKRNAPPPPPPAPFLQPSRRMPSPPLPPLPTSSSTPPLYSPAYGRRGEGSAGISSADRDRDRPPWDRISNGYEGDVDGTSRRRQSPAPIDTTSRRRREPSASSSDYNFSPTSPQAAGSLPPPISISPLVPSRRGQPQHSLGSAATPTYLAPQAPPSHRRRESETAAQEREQALEASERLRENQSKEYDSQYRKMRIERERQGRRQQQVPTPGESSAVTPVHKSHRSESVDSGAGAPHGWVLVNEVFPNGPTSDPAAPLGTSSSRYPNVAPRSTSFSRANTTGQTADNWMGSPPSDSPRFSPGSTVPTPSPSRPYPHTTNTPFSSQVPPTRSGTGGGTGGGSGNGSTTPLQRSHPPLPVSSGKYPNPHPHPRCQGNHAALPPGAVDPRMRQLERQLPPPVTNGPSGFYPSAVGSSYAISNSPSSYANGTSGGSSSSSRMLQPNVNGGRGSGQDGTGSSSGLRSPRSLSDLRQYSPTNSGFRAGMGGATPTSSQTSLQMPLLSRKPSALPPGTHMNEGPYGSSRTPSSPNRLPPPSPSRPILSPSSFYNGSSSGSGAGAGSMMRSAATPLDYSTGGSSGVARSLGNTGLFSGGVFVDAPLGATPAERNRLRSRQSYDRLNALDRTVAAHREPPPPMPPLPMSGVANQQTPGGSYRYGWLSSPAGSRPQSGDTEPPEVQSRPSPVDSSPADALNRLEARRPSVAVLSVPASIDDNAPLTSPYSDTSSNAIQIPQAVITPSSPINGPLGDNNGTHSPDVPLAASPAISATSSQELTDDGSEGTLRPGDRAHLISLMGSDNDADGEGNGGGTMKPRLSLGGSASTSSVGQTGMGIVVTGTAKRVSMRRARAKSVRANTIGTQAEPQTENPEEEYEDDDEYSDEEDDDRFWNTSSAASTQTPPTIRVTSRSDDDGASTLIPGDSRTTVNGKSRGPSLTLQISPIASDSGSNYTPETASSSGQTLTPSQHSPSGVTPTSTVNRRASFRRDTWAFRPSAEDVYDRLQDFFPDHDLDKPFIEPVAVPGAINPPPSPTATATPAQIPVAASPPTKESKFKHRKSIRFVAEERKKALERIQTKGASAGRAADLARKRSTKMWGSRVEEVTPGQVKSGMPPSIPESPTAEQPARPTIKWVKGELIGKGTYGKVFLALNVTTGEMLAVKQVEMPQTISDQDDVRQVNIVNALKAERETLESLDHPNIVQYLGFEQTKEFFSVFLEYVPGGSIGSCLRKHGKFAEDTIKSFTGQIIDGLAYLHDNKIIHRDVKADNVLVDPSGTCKISDFGISKRSDEIYNNAAMTAMQGSLFWMAPEMLHNNKKGYNAKIDIWSLGCVLIEMFAGRRPWEQDDFVSVMFKVGHNKMAPPVPDDVTLSRDADDFRLQCFIQDPDERPTAQALRGHPWLILDRAWRFTGF